jgi:prepilin-type N-terminal cleavage/methylation domain-containing protein
MSGGHFTAPFPEPARRGDGMRRAFTLVEILLTLAMLALLGAVLLPSAGGLLRPHDPGRPDDMIAEVLQEVRREAVLTGREVALRFEVDKQRFAWDGSERSLSREGPRVTVDFLRPSATTAVLIGGQMVETHPVPVLRFFPDGTCDPIRLQWRVAGGAGQIMAIDPWTCAPGLEVKP